MSKKKFLFIHNIWTQIAIVIIFLLFVSHLVAFFLLSRYNEQTQLNINRGIVARQIITLVEAVQINPPDKRAYIVNAIDIPNVSISLDNYPKYKLRAPEMEIWDVLLKIRSVPQTARSISISVKVDKHLWLNISALILQSSLAFQAILLGFELIIVFALLLVIWLINRFNKPLKRFVSAVEKMGNTLNPNALSEIDGPQMVREAAKAVNNMQGRINDLIRDRTQMLAAISHDLRTPLTRLKLRAQFITDEEQHQKIIDDLDEMENMINESLAFFRDGQQVLRKTTIDLASLLSSLCIDYQETNRNVRYAGPHHNISFEGNSLALKRAFSNIIDNAVKFGSLAKVTLIVEEQNYKITVVDNGPGISEQEIEKVFMPFYRGEQSRSRATGGIGLGLAVARNIIVAHDGEISLQLPEEGGLCVTITLPINIKK